MAARERRKTGESEERLGGRFGQGKAGGGEGGVAGEGAGEGAGDGSIDISSAAIVICRASTRTL